MLPIEACIEHVLAALFMHVMFEEQDWSPTSGGGECHSRQHAASRSPVVVVRASRASRWAVPSLLIAPEKTRNLENTTCCSCLLALEFGMRLAAMPLSFCEMVRTVCIWYLTPARSVVRFGWVVRDALFRSTIGMGHFHCKSSHTSARVSFHFHMCRLISAFRFPDPRLHPPKLSALHTR